MRHHLIIRPYRLLYLLTLGATALIVYDWGALLILFLATVDVQLRRV